MWFISTSPFNLVHSIGEAVVLEPLIKLRILNEGVMKNTKLSVVPVKIIEEKPIFEDEIKPGVSRHIVKALRESKGKEEAEKMLRILKELPFNNKCTFLLSHIICFKKKNNR